MNVQRKSKTDLFGQGVGVNQNSTKRDRICMSIDRRYFAMLSGIYNLQGSEIAPIESKLDNTKRFAIGNSVPVICTYFPCTHEKSRGTVYKRGDPRFLSLLHIHIKLHTLP